jgi:broad specificity phosphatase PhoE
MASGGAQAGPLCSAAVSTPAQARVYLARHGQTAYNLERRFQGQLPVGLDDTGREQGVDLAERASAHSFAALWCSPLLRARETADIVAERIGLEPREDPRLMETDAGEWTDRLFSDVQAEAPDAFAGFIDGDPSFAFPDGESFAQQGVRVAAALADVERDDLPALVVCHGVVIRIALYQRAGHRVALAERVPNGALVPLDPIEAEHADLGGGEALPPS